MDILKSEYTFSVELGLKQFERKKEEITIKLKIDKQEELWVLIGGKY